MKNYFLTIIAIVTFSGASFSQVDYELNRAIDLFRQNKIAGGETKIQLYENDIQGSPYLCEEFINGTLFTTSKTKYVDVPIRFNIYNDAVEFKTAEDQVQSLAAPEIVEKIELGEYQMAYIPFSVLKKIRRGFFIILEEGKVSLYSRPNILFIKATEPGPYLEAQPARFERKPDTFYIRVGMEDAKLVENKRDLLDILPDHAEKLEEFIKKNKTKFNNAESLKELVKYCNSL